jgi:FKBP-type peptidyl-prolyl cis-trans isomerase
MGATGWRTRGAVRPAFGGAVWWAVAGVAAAAVFAGAVALDLSHEPALTGGRGGLEVGTVQEGSGVAAARGDEVAVSYSVSLEDGTPIDALDLLGRGKTHRFIVGDGTVIAGLDEGVVGMRAGGVRTLDIPPRLHFGSGGGAGLIPPGTRITMRVEMVSVRQNAGAAVARR